jgi:uncharacterized protein YceH (UPF0502 family)
MPEGHRLDPTERRIIGVMIEKAFTVPDAYPLTLNALVSGCAQKSNREPVMDVPEHHVEGALKALFIDGWVEKSSRHGGRVARWGHRVPDRLGLDAPRQAILAELLLRGPQTLGALRGRASRMVPLATTDEVLEILEELARPERGLVERLPRRPGERAEKWRHLLGDEDEAPTLPPPEPAAVPGPSPEERLAACEAEIRELRDELRTLREEVDRLQEL